jgi:hypothetical protein
MLADHAQQDSFLAVIQQEAVAGDVAHDMVELQLERHRLQRVELEIQPPFTNSIMDNNPEW